MTSKIIQERNIVRARAWIVSLLSVAGIYFAITNHTLALAVLVFDILALLLLSNSEIFCVIFFLMPFTMIFKRSPASTSLFTYLNIAVVLYLLFKNNRKIKFSKPILLHFVFFAVYMCLGMQENYTGYLKLFFAFLMAILFIQLVPNSSFSQIIVFQSVGGVASCFIGLQKNTWSALRTYFSEINFEYIDGIRTERFSALYKDPNYFSTFVLLCIFSILIFTFLKKINKTATILLLIPLFVFGCMTYSKLFYIGIAIITIMFMLILVRNSKHKGTAVLGFCFICLFALWIAGKYGFLSNIILRFGKEDFSTGRLDIWSRYLKYILSSLKALFFGEGIGASPYQGVGAHNTYIEVLYYLGIIGGTIYFSMITAILKIKKIDSKRKVLNYSSLILFMFAIATVGTLFTHDFIYLLLIIWMMLNTDLSAFQKKEIV